MGVRRGGDKGALTDHCRESGEKEWFSRSNCGGKDYRGFKQVPNEIAGSIDARSWRGSFKVGNPFANPGDELVPDQPKRL